MAVMEYQTRDGLADFGFSIEFQSNLGWRVYIIFEPFRCGDDHNLDLPYQCIDGDGRRYVNWSPVLDNLGDAKTVAALWAELAHRDQRTKKEHRLYVELIQRHHCKQKQKTVTSAHSDHLRDTVDAERPDPENHDHATIIPHARTPAQSFGDCRQGRWTAA